MAKELLWVSMQFIDYSLFTLGSPFALLVIALIGIYFNMNRTVGYVNNCGVVESIYQ